jgi:hypothetical protein
MYQPLIDPGDIASIEEKPVIVELSPSENYDPEEGHCKIRNGVIVCNDCGAPADTVHFVPWVVVSFGASIEIRAACAEHDPGGYWLPLSELITEPLKWLLHISEKRGAPDHELLQWLGYPGVALLGKKAGPRKGQRCAYCGSTAGPMELDHIVPKSRGGPDDKGNRVWACRDCNRRKGTKSLLEWLDELRQP